MEAVCSDFETAPISEKEKGLLRYVAKVNDAPSKVDQADVDAAKAHGWSESAIFDAATVAATFNFFNRWIDATGVPAVPAGFYEERLTAHGDVGYAM